MPGLIFAQHRGEKCHIKCSDPSRISALSAAYQIMCSAQSFDEMVSEYRNKLQRDKLIAEAGNLSRFRSADALASAAGMAPVLRQSGRTRFLRRPNGGNKGLKRVFYQSALCSLNHDDSRTFYDRKRREGKRHHHAVIALARRRVNVLWAVLHSRTLFQPGVKTAA